MIPHRVWDISQRCRASGLLRVRHRLDLRRTVATQLRYQAQSSLPEGDASTAEADRLQQGMLVRHAASKEKLHCAPRYSPLAIAELGKELFCAAIADVDPCWHFYPLPWQWPATFLVQHRARHADGLVDNWLPIVLRTTTAGSLTSNGRRLKCGQTSPPDTRKIVEKERFFFRLPQGNGRSHPFLQVFVALESSKFFMIPAGRHSSDSEKQQNTGAQHFLSFSDADQVGLDDILGEMLAKYQEAERNLRSRCDWFAFFHDECLVRGTRAAYCRALIQMQLHVYGPLGLDVSFPNSSLRSAGSHNATVGNFKVLHRIANAQTVRDRGARPLSVTATSESQAKRPYSSTEMNSLDFLCALNYCVTSHQLDGFYFFPKWYAAALFSGGEGKADKCKCTMWLYFPEDGHRAKLEHVKKRLSEDLKFYVNLREPGSDPLVKLRQIISDYQSTSATVTSQ
ncbi:unnamed protein product [Amoebophrya sp. A120]|nr:unnamed protein product [Amoebophrya sp. A120]|eukprot:GSA120T00020195001.1